MDRRSFLRHSGSTVFGWLIGIRLWRRRALAQEEHAKLWAVRRVQPGDEAELLDLMKSCVIEQDAFHGLCNAIEWTDTWAEAVVSDRPRSIVLTLNDTVVAYFDLPSNEPRMLGQENLDRNERAFWCGAAGVRMDLLGEEQSVEVFQRLLFQAFSDAMSLGYEFVRAAAPWPQHPYLPKPFKEYSGLTIQPFVDEKGATKYLLEWRLSDAVEALVAEGANQDLALS
jgi:hypothetical protein